MFPITYEVTSASIHDIKMDYDLIEQAPNKQILTDKGYISEQLKQDCHAIGIDLWKPPRKNQQIVEIVTSSLSSLGAQSFRSLSIAGFEARLEVILLTLTYSFMLEKAQIITPGTLRYSLGLF